MLDDNKDFYINTLRNIVKTDNGYCLQKVYYENENGEIKSTKENEDNLNKNLFFKQCCKCTHSSNGNCLVRTRLENLPENQYISYHWVANCDAYSPIFPLNIIKSKEEMIWFIENTENFFDCPESYETYFGFERKWDEITGDILESTREYYNRGGEFKNIPNKFPCVIYFGVVDFDGERNNDEKLDWICIEDEVNHMSIEQRRMMSCISTNHI